MAITDFWKNLFSPKVPVQVAEAAAQEEEIKALSDAELRKESLELRKICKRRHEPRRGLAEGFRGYKGGLQAHIGPAALRRPAVGRDSPTQQRHSRDDDRRR